MSPSTSTYTHSHFESVGHQKVCSMYVCESERETDRERGRERERDRERDYTGPFKVV